MATNTNETKPVNKAQNEVASPANGGEDKLVAKVSKKLIVWISAGLGVCLVAGLAWFFIHRSGTNKAAELTATADMAYIKAMNTPGENADSIALPLYLKAAAAGYDSGNRAKIMAGSIYYKQGKYQDALKQFEDASLDGELVQPGIYIARGNCYANLKKYDDALKNFRKAESEAEGNAAVAPYAIIKQANIYQVQKKYKEEAECYERILNDYPEFAANEYLEVDETNPAAANYNDGTGRDIKRYYERAKALAGGK